MLPSDLHHEEVVKEIIQTEGSWYQIETWIFIIEWRALGMVNIKDDFFLKSLQNI